MSLFKFRLAVPEDLGKLRPVVEQSQPALVDYLEEILERRVCIIAESSNESAGAETTDGKILAALFVDYNAYHAETVMICGLAYLEGNGTVLSPLIIWFRDNAARLFGCQALVTLVPLEDLPSQLLFWASGFDNRGLITLDGDRQALVYRCDYEDAATAEQMTFRVATADDRKNVRAQFLMQFPEQFRPYIEFLERLECAVALDGEGTIRGSVFFECPPDLAESLVIVFFHNDAERSWRGVPDLLIQWLQEMTVEKFGRARLMAMVPTTDHALQRRFAKNGFTPAPLQRTAGAVELEFDVRIPKRQAGQFLPAVPPSDPISTRHL